MVNDVNRVKALQIEFLAHCMEQFPSLALASFGKSREETSCAHKKWLQIGSALNKIKPGVMKTGLGWLKYWTNYKCQLRKRYPQFKDTWLRDAPERVSPTDLRFLQILADHERSRPLLVTFLGSRNSESDPITDKEGEDVPTKNYPEEKTSQSIPANQETTQLMRTLRETSQPIKKLREMSQPMETLRESSQPMAIMQEISQSMRTLPEISQPTKRLGETSQSMKTFRETSQPMKILRETSQPMKTLGETSQPMPTMQVVDVSMECSPELPYVQDDDDYNSKDPIGTEIDIEEEIQVKILKYNLKKQKEMHKQKMAWMKERHRLMMEVLQIKKKKLIHDCDRLRRNVRMMPGNV